MDAQVLSILSAVGFICGLMGWSYKTLSSQIDALQADYRDKPEVDTVRQLIDDKLAVHDARLKAINDKLDFLVYERRKT